MVNIPPYLQFPWLESLADRETLLNLLRLTAIICGYLLIRPHIDTLFHKISGAPDTRAEVLKARVEARTDAERERQARQEGRGKKER